MKAVVGVVILVVIVVILFVLDIASGAQGLPVVRPVLLGLGGLINGLFGQLPSLIGTTNRPLEDVFTTQFFPSRGIWTIAITIISIMAVIAILMTVARKALSHTGSEFVAITEDESVRSMASPKVIGFIVGTVILFFLIKSYGANIVPALVIAVATIVAVFAMMAMFSKGVRQGQAFATSAVQTFIDGLRMFAMVVSFSGVTGIALGLFQRLVGINPEVQFRGADMVKTTTIDNTLLSASADVMRFFATASDAQVIVACLIAGAILLATLKPELVGFGSQLTGGQGGGGRART